MKNTESIVVPIILIPFEVGETVGVYTYINTFSDNKIMKFMGYCTYEGDHKFDDEVSTNPYQSYEEKIKLLEEEGAMTFPRLRAADGTVMWGGDVWFDSVSNIEYMKKECDEVQYVDPQEFNLEVEQRRVSEQHFLDILNDEGNILDSYTDFDVWN